MLVAVWEQRHADAIAIWVTWSSPAAQTHQGTEQNETSGFLWTHREMMRADPRLPFSCTAALPIYIQGPPPLRHPVEWVTPGYICASKKKYWVEIALTLAPVPQWSHPNSWSIMMSFCWNCDLQLTFSFFTRKTNFYLSHMLKFHL